jgi:uncharacterized protein
VHDVNPFVYSRPIAPEEVVDRDEETDRLLELAAGGHYARLFAPRKFGKTSLLGRVLYQGEKAEGFVPVLVDLYGVLSIADMAVRIERAYAKHLKGAVRKRVDGFLQSTGLGLSLGAYGISARLQLDPRADPLPALHSLLDLPLRLEAGGGFRALVVFDEFQDITKVPEMDALLRAHIQYQGEVASYIFSGSEQGMMEQLFGDKDRPLYGSAVPMRLGPLPSADLAAHVSRQFAATGKDAGDAVNPLLATARGHPQRAIQLAHWLWQATPDGETATFATWEATLETVLTELQPEFDARWRSLDTSEQKALRAVIAGDGSPLRGGVLERLDAEKTTIYNALQRLARTADVARDGRGWEIVDPLFEVWITRLAGPVIR